MRRLIVATVLPILVSCTAFDCFGVPDALVGGRPRKDVLSSGGMYANRDGGGLSEGLRKDTTLYISVLEFPDGYDWRKDSAYTASGASIVLYRDFERVLSVKTGVRDMVGTGADMHHIIQGHLVSEYVGSNDFVVKLDGKEVFRAGRRENLRGLVLKDDVLYSLSQINSGHGFVLRKGAKVIFEKSEGEILGKLGADCHFRGGALYLDCGQLCFAYRTSKGSVLVEDGEEKAIAESGNIVDVRKVKGELCLVENKNGTIQISAGDCSRTLLGTSSMISGTFRISVMDGAPVVICEIHNRYGSSTTEIHSVEKNIKNFLGIHTIVPTAKGIAHIDNPSGKGLVIYGSDGRETRLEGACLWFGTASTCSIGGDVIAACTPYSTDSKPAVYYKGEWKMLDVNGFATGVDIVVNHPS